MANRGGTWQKKESVTGHVARSVEKPVGSHASGQRLLDFLRDEIEVYLTLDHPHIAKLHDVRGQHQEGTQISIMVWHPLLIWCVLVRFR